MDPKLFVKTKAVLPFDLEAAYLGSEEQEIALNTYIFECIEHNIPMSEMFKETVAFEIWMVSRNENLLIKLFDDRWPLFQKIAGGAE